MRMPIAYEELNRIFMRSISWFDPPPVPVHGRLDAHVDVNDHDGGTNNANAKSHVA